MVNRRWLALLLTLSGAACGLGGAAPASAAPAGSAAPVRAAAPVAADPPPGHSVGGRRACAAPHGRQAGCNVLLRTVDGQPSAEPPPPPTAQDRPTGQASPATFTGYTPTDIQGAYNLSPTGGAGTLVAVVDAFDDPNAESDLATYRSHFGLSACTTQNGCFRKVAQDGSTNYPSTDSSGGWELEEALDIEAVSAACPACHILLVEADSSDLTSLFTAVDTARGLGSSIISMSWGAQESSGIDSPEDAHLQHPGVAFVASSGDNGFVTEYPASSPLVTAVGGTRLVTASNVRGWSETVWSGTGSGCSAFESKPAWQAANLCTTRIVADAAADADPGTGLACYDSFGGSAGIKGWTPVGGTSLGAPVIAATYALGGGEGAAVGAQPFYRNTSTFDVTSGTTTGCPNQTNPLCNGEVGYDGPTGMGTPNGPPQPIPAPTGATSPNPVGFGNQPVGSQSSASTVTVSNTASVGLLLVGSVSLGGSNPGEFQVAQDGCSGQTISPGASCAVKVVFQPTQTGARSASLQLPSNAANGPLAAALGGTGTQPGIHLSTTSLSFASATVGTTTSPQSVTVSSNGTADLVVGTVSVTGAAPADFPETADTCSGQTLAPSSTCSVSVAFHPTDQGGRTATITIADNAPGSPHQVSLSGSGSVPAPFVPAVYGGEGTDRQLWTGSTTSPGFTPLGGLLLAAPAVVQLSSPATHLYIAVGGDHRLYQRTDSHGWSVLDATAYCIDNPGANLSGSTLYVACQGGDNGLWVAAGSVDGAGLASVGTFRSYGGILFAGPAVSPVVGSADMIVFVIGGGGNVYQVDVTQHPFGGSFFSLNAQGWICQGHMAVTTAAGGNSYFGCNGANQLYVGVNLGSGWITRPAGGYLLDGVGATSNTSGAVFVVEGGDRGSYYQGVDVLGNPQGFVARGGQFLTGLNASG